MKTEDTTKLALSDHEPIVDVTLGNRIKRLHAQSVAAVFVAAAALLLGVLVGAGGVYWFGHSTEQLDRLGGFLAGTTGALWSAAGLFLIFAAFLAQLRQSALQEEEIRLNRLELRQTQVELRGQKEQLEAQSRTFKQQQFESTFFQLLALHHQIVNGIDRVEKPLTLAAVFKPSRPEPAPEEFRGRDVFVRIFRDLKSTQKSFEEEYGPADLSVTVNEIYKRVYTRNQSDLGHYFRNLYTLIKFVKNSDVQDKHAYTNIVRAQLSTYELLLLFYNCLSEHGREKFKPLIEEFHLLKNMPQERVLDGSHIEAYSPSAFARPAVAQATYRGDASDKAARPLLPARVPRGPLCR